MLFIKDTSAVPTDGFRYPGINGHTVVVRNYQLLYSTVKAHYTANNQPVPTEEEVTRWICENLRLECYDGQVPIVSKWVPAKRTRCCGEKV